MYLQINHFKVKQRKEKKKRRTFFLSSVKLILQLIRRKGFYNIKSSLTK